MSLSVFSGQDHGLCIPQGSLGPPRYAVSTWLLTYYLVYCCIISLFNCDYFNCVVIKFIFIFFLLLIISASSYSKLPPIIPSGPDNPYSHIKSTISQCLY